MGREVRRVPADWQHPKKDNGGYIPLFEGYKSNAAAFMLMAKNKGLQEAVDYMGCPDKNDYMPDFEEKEKTHYMMYEDTTEGTPISPAFKEPEELAKWLTNSNGSAFGDMTGSYDGWLRVAKGGFAPSAVLDANGLRSGVDIEPIEVEDK